MAQTVDYRPNVVIFKVKDEYRANCDLNTIDVPELERAIAGLKSTKLFQKFPLRTTANRSAAKKDPKVNISLIYELHYESAVDPYKAARMLLESGAVEYAEPAFIAHVIETPNDALISKQWHLENVRAFEAWDIEKSSEDVLIAIIDTGVDWDHPDLRKAIAHNENDPIDGIDNDANGYVDDYRGWNFYNNNNNPDELSWSHGTHVAGLAAAVPNNGLFGAGTGYNSRILAIKAGNQLELSHGYESIVYATEMGADIINCSWGGTPYTAMGEDIVNYATASGALIVCGAGNNNNDLDFYPGSFQATLNVAATDSLDQRSDFSSFYHNVDIAAPGTLTWSTKNDTVDDQGNRTDPFQTESGTSMSSPIVAGAAALVKAHFPDLTPEQIKAQLMNTAKDIYGIDANKDYIDRLGTGLLDMRAALESIRAPAIMMDSFAISDTDGDGLFTVNESGRLGIELVNWLGSSNNITVILSSLDTLVNVTDGVRQFSSLDELARTDNFDNPFEFEVLSKRGYNETVHLRLTISDGTYVRNEYVHVLINPDFVNVAVNNIASTVSSAGQIGYADILLSKGLGFKLEGYGNLLYEAGLMVGARQDDINKVLDRVRGEADSDRDFWPTAVLEKRDGPTDEAFYALGAFNDTSANYDEMDLSASQKVWAYNKVGHENYMVVEYTIFNGSDGDLRDLHVGLFADWDIGNSSENRGETAQGKRLSMVYGSNEAQPWAGIQALNSDKPFHSYLIDNANNGNGGVDISYGNGGFNSDEKLITLTQNRFTEGQEGSGTDVSHVVSTGGFYLPIGDSITVAFAIMAATSKDELLSVADAAFQEYNGFLPGGDVHAPFQFRSLSPNPTNGDFRLEFSLQNDSDLEYYLYNTQGVLVENLGSSHLYGGANLLEFKLEGMASGLYILRVLGPDIERSFLVSFQRP